MSKEDMITLLLEISDNNKQTREYLKDMLYPDEKKVLNKYKAIIIDEFYLKKNILNPSMEFSICNKAIDKFRGLDPAPKLMADLMLTLSETTCKFAADFYEMCELDYDRTAINFNMVLYYMREHDLLAIFKKRCENCVDYASNCKNGFDKEIADMHYQYYPEKIKLK